MDYTLLSGINFNEFYKCVKFYVVTNDRTQFDYKDGYNEVSLKQKYNYIDGGIKFSEHENLLKLIKSTWNAKYVIEVTVPDDAVVIIDKNDYVADKLILNKKILVEDLEFWNDETFSKSALETDPLIFDADIPDGKSASTKGLNVGGLGDADGGPA